MAKLIVRSYRGERESVGIDFKDPSLAVQASKDECDLNVIIKKYLRTGELPGLRQTVYGDISKIGNLKECLDQAYAAEEAFMALPADIRRHFDNDPVKLVEFASDDSNYDKAVELGLVIPKAKPVSPSQQVPSAPGQGAPNAVGGTPANPAKSGS